MDTIAPQRHGEHREEASLTIPKSLLRVLCVSVVITFSPGST